MNKIIIFVSFLIISLIFWTPAMAKKESGALSAPENVTSNVINDNICLSWDTVDKAAKYAVNVNVDVDSNGDGIADTQVEFSFNTADRTDGLEPSAPNLCIPLADFVYDIDQDGDLERISGKAYVKIKALNPGQGKGQGRQNSAFSDELESSMTPPEPTVEDPILKLLK